MRRSSRRPLYSGLFQDTPEGYRNGLEFPTGRSSIYRLTTANGRDVTKGRAILEDNSIASGWNYDILTSIVTKLLTSRSFGDLIESVWRQQALTTAVSVTRLSCFVDHHDPIRPRLGPYRVVMIKTVTTGATSGRGKVICARSELSGAYRSASQ